jgi:hypothetical protein
VVALSILVTEYIMIPKLNILIKFTLTVFILSTLVACYESKMKQEGEQAVNAFLEEMSPELARKIKQIQAEIALTEEKLQKLSELKLKHPNYAETIENSRRKWQVLQNKLKQSLKEIQDVVESTYVMYELNKIEGGNQFNKISDTLLNSADSVLISASTSKNAIEQALNEVENQIVDIHSTPKPHKSVEDKTYLCDANTYLATVRLNLTMILMSTDKTEQEALRVEIDKASAALEKQIIATKLLTLQKTWAIFKKTYKTEILPAIRAGNNDKASKIAVIQAENLKTMKNIIQAINEKNCD